MSSQISRLRLLAVGLCSLMGAQCLGDLEPYERDEFTREPDLKQESEVNCMGRNNIDGNPRDFYARNSSVGINPNSVRLGNKLVLKRPPQLTPGNDLYGTRQRFATARLLTVNLKDIDPNYQNGPGAWVLTLSGSIKSDVGVIGGEPSPNVYAELVFGAGATTQRVVVDAWRNVISLPSETVSVDVYFEGFGPKGENIGFATPNYFPDEVEIVGTLHRAIESQSETTVTYWFLSPSDSIKIPAFARQWYYIIPFKPSGDFSDGALVNIYETDGGIVTDQIPNAGLASMARSMCPRFIPPNASRWSWDPAGPAPYNSAGKVSFVLNL